MSFFTKNPQQNARLNLVSSQRGNFFILLALSAVLALSSKFLYAQTTYYWDTNQGTAGLGGTGTWASTGNTNWNTSSTGGSGTYTAAPGTTDTLNFNGTAGLVTLSNSASITNRYAALNFNTSGYVLTTASSSSLTISNATTTLGNNVSLIISNLPGILGFRGGVMTGGTGSTVSLAGNTDFYVGLENFDISNTVSIDMSGTTGSAKVIGFAERAGSSTIRANVINNSQNFFGLGANSTRTLNMYGVVSGTGGISLSTGTSGGTGTYNLYGVNTYQGNTLINAGTSASIRIRVNNAISTASFLQYGSVANSGGILDLYGNSQTIAGITSGASAVGSITNSQAGLSTLTINQSANTTFGLSINGNLALVKTNSGSLTLTGVNTYSNGTTVSGGTLVASNSSALGTGSVSVGSGGTLSIQATITNTVASSGTLSIGEGGALTAATLGGGSVSLQASAGKSATLTSTASGALSMGALSLSGNSTIYLPFGGSINSSGAVSATGSGNSINLLGSSTYTNGSYTLITGSTVPTTGLTLTGPGVGGLSIALGSSALQGRNTFSFSADASATPQALKLDVVGSSWNVNWNGGATGNWNTTDASWQKDGAGSNVAFASGDNATLGTAADIAVDLGGITAGTLTVNPTSGTVAMSGGPLGVLGLLKSGAGALQLSNTLTSSGAITNSAGSLTSFTNFTVSSGGLTVSGGNVTLNGTNAITNGLTVSGGTILLSGGNTIAGGIAVSSGSATLGTNSSITGGVVVSGGTLNLNQSNSLSGGVSLTGGVLVVSHAQALGAGTLTLNGGTLCFTNNSLSGLSNSITLGTAGGTVSNTTQMTLATALSDTGPFTKSGSGKLIMTNTIGASGSARPASMSLTVNEGELELAAANKYLTNTVVNGQLTLNGGTLFTRGADITGTGSILITNSVGWTNTIGGIAVAPAVNLATGSTLTLGPSTTNTKISLNGGLNGSGNIALVSSANATEVRVSGSGSASGIFTVGTGSVLKLTNFSAPNLGFANNGSILFSNSATAGDRTWNKDITGTGSISTDGSGTQTFAGNITAAGAFSMGSSGAITLLGSNTFNGLNISGSGGVNIGKSNSIGSGLISNNVASGVVKIDGSAGTGNDWTLANNVVTGVSGTDVMAFGPGAGNILRLSGVVTGTGQLKITSGGDLYINNSGNTYTGGTEVGTGRILVANPAVLGSGAINFGTTANSFLVATANLTITNTLTIGSSSVNGYTANIDTGTNNMIVSGTITNRVGNANGGNLVKLGSGTLTLSGAIGYTGTTTVQEGTLVTTSSSFTAAITSNTIAVTLSNTPAVGATFKIISAPLTGTYPTPGVTGLGVGQGVTWDNATDTLTIVQTSQPLPSVTFTAPGPGLVYSGSPKTYSADAGGTSLTLTYTGRNGLSYSNTVPPTNVGDYTVTATATGYTGSQSTDFSITKKPLTVSGATATSRAYDGGTNVVVSGGTLAGVVGSEEVTLSGTPAGTVASAAVGNSKDVTVTGYALGGTAAANYSLSQPTDVKVNITAKGLTVGAPTLTKSKVFDGTASVKGSVTVGALSGKVGSEDVRVTATATYDSAAVGTGKTITVVYSLDGNDKGNYTAPANTTLDDGVILSLAQDFFGSLSATNLGPDGVSMLLRYAYGGTTNGNMDRALMPASVISGSNLVMTYYARTNDTNLTVQPEKSDGLGDIGSWGTNGITIQDGSTTNVNGVALQQRTASVGTSTNDRQFLRLKVELKP